MNKTPRIHCENNESLRVVLCNWLIRNIKVPTDTSSLIAFVILILVAWFIVNTIIKFLLSILYPILIITSAVLIYPFARDGNMTALFSQCNELGRDVVLKLFQMITSGFKALSSSIRQ